jgi:hypothetical protein
MRPNPSDGPGDHAPRPLANLMRLLLLLRARKKCASPEVSAARPPARGKTGGKSDKRR